MKFVVGIIIAVGLLVAANLAFISDDLQAGNIPDYTKESGSLTMMEKPEAKSGTMATLTPVADEMPEETVSEVVEEPVEEPVVIPVVNPSVIITEDTVGSPLVIEIEFLGSDSDIVDHINYDLFATQDGSEIISDVAAHRHPGVHPVHTSNADLSESDVEIEIIVQGIGHGEDITEPIGQSTIATISPVVVLEEPDEEIVEKPAIEEPVVMAPIEGAATEAEVLLGIGSGVPGCEATDECYIPHTVTAGDIDADPNSVGTAYPDGFDSGFFLAGNSYSHTFENAGEYPYYCMVHPWMQGVVVVQ